MNVLRIFIVAYVMSSFALPSLGNDEPSSLRKCVALTFDDGPDTVLTPRLLAILREANVRATFYLVGSRVVLAPEVVRDIQRDGHEIGNHSWNHANLARLSLREIRREIDRTDQAIAAITGAPPHTVRPPYGAVSALVRSALAPRPVVLWDVDTLDWRYRVRAWITRTAGTNIHSGSVVLMHDIHQTSIAAVPDIIAGLRKSGYIFVTVSELSAGMSSFCESPKTR